MLSLLLIVSVITVSSNIVPVSANENNAVAFAESLTDDSQRTNLTYIDGQAGDTHLVYTYPEKGISYKVIKDSNESFTEVYSTIYVFDASLNEYVFNAVSTYSTSSNGYGLLEYQNIDGSYYQDVFTFENNYDTSSKLLSFAESFNLSSVPDYEWHTESTDSSAAIANATISALIAIISGIIIGFSGLHTLSRTYQTKNTFQRTVLRPRQKVFIFNTLFYFLVSCI